MYLTMWVSGNHIAMFTSIYFFIPKSERYRISHAIWLNLIQPRVEILFLFFIEACLNAAETLNKVVFENYCSFFGKMEVQNFRKNKSYEI